MSSRCVPFFVLLLLVLSTGWVVARERQTPEQLMKLSDTLYYYPAARGLKDLVVDLDMRELPMFPAAKDAHISFIFAGEGQQRFEVANLPATADQTRKELVNLLEPLSNFITPRPSASAFSGLTLTTLHVWRQLPGLPAMDFTLLIGATKDTNAPVKEYRVLLDRQGLAHQVENVMKDGSVISARIENHQDAGAWHIARVTTRMMSADTPQWRIDSVEYGTVNGFTLPLKATIQFRNSFNQPIKGVNDLSVIFTNYRINSGAGAALFAPAK